MLQWTHKRYEALERAITSGTRISVYRRGTEFIVVPTRLRIIQNREAIDAVHPTTGENITIYLDEMDSLEVVR